MGFSREQLKVMSIELKQALAGFEEKYNVKVTVGSITYSEMQFTTKLTVESNVKFSEEGQRKDFERSCILYGLKPEDYGKVISVEVRRGVFEDFKLIGFENSRRKYPLRAIRQSDKKEMLLTTDVLKN